MAHLARIRQAPGPNVPEELRYEEAEGDGGADGAERLSRD